MKRQCQCCGFYTIGGNYEICPVCFWEDDPIQAERPDCAGGANSISLIEAKKNFAMYGACEERLAKYVRAPKDDEK